MDLIVTSLDIYLQEAPGGYVARAEVSGPGGASARQASAHLAQLLGGVTLKDIYRTDAPPAAGEGGTDFVKSLVKLRDGFYGEADVDTVGADLFDALPLSVRDLYNLSWGAVSPDDERLLRVRLHFDSDELAMLPWEFMKPNDTFLLEHLRRSLVRVPDSGEQLTQPAFAAPLKLLVWAANPKGTDPLDFQKEVDDIRQALQAGLAGTAQIVVKTSGSALELMDELGRGYHILHFIGHGVLDPATGQGILQFEPQPGADAVTVNALQLRQGIWNNPTLRLVFLNSCETAAGAPNNAYASLGLNLARFTPAVVAMQTAISSNSAGWLAQRFYAALANSAGQPPDVLLNQARKALIAQFPQRPMDWGIPALFARSDLDLQATLASVRIASVFLTFASQADVDLYDACRAALLESGAFDSDNSVRNLFSNPRISSYLSSIPAGSNAQERVDAFLGGIGRRILLGVPVLALVFEVLAERLPQGDPQRDQFASLAQRVRAKVKS